MHAVLQPFRSKFAACFWRPSQAKQPAPNQQKATRDHAGWGVVADRFGRKRPCRSAELLPSCHKILSPAAAFRRPLTRFGRRCNRI